MLLEKLKQDAGDIIFEKAMSYYQSAAIKPYSYTPSGANRYQIKAIVKASGAFGVNINLDFNNDRFKIDPYCTCTSGNDTLCEHTTAVVYKFIADDFPKLNPGLMKPAAPEGIQLLKLAAGPEVPLKLFYQIDGLADTAENFTIFFQIQDDNNPLTGQLVECLGDIKYSARKREQILNSFNGFDILVISYLEKVFCGKDPKRKYVSVTKSNQNFQLILVLIENGRALNYQNSQPLELGESLKPRVTISGDETRLQFTYDTAEFENVGFCNHHLNYIIHENTVHPISNSDFAKIPPEIEIPPGQLGLLLFEILPQLDAKIRLELGPELLAHRSIMREPEITLLLDYEEGQVICRPEIKLLNQVYNHQECRQLLTQEPKYERSETDPYQWFTINRQSLTELSDFLKRFQFEFTSAGWIIKEREFQFWFIRNGWPQLQDKWAFRTTAAFAEFKVIPVKLEPLVELELDEKIDWFEFHISYNLGGQTYTHQQIMSLLKRFGSGNYLQIGSQWFFIEDSAKFDLLQQNLSIQTGPVDIGRERIYNLAFLRDLFAEHGVQIKGNSIYDRFERDISRSSLLESNPIPDCFRGELRDYQQKGFQWLQFLHKYRCGGILADDMGLGKTVQVLTLLKSIPKPEPALIICPRSLIYNWAAEIDKFYPETAYLVYHGTPEVRQGLRSSFTGNEIIITTYDTIVIDIEILQEFLFYYCILDEAQHIKNRETRRAKDCKRINSRYRLVLTGTPVENRLEDLWALFDFLMPGYLGSLPVFQTNYCITLRKAKRPENLALLRKKIAPFILRRLKEEVLAELPPKTLFTREVAMSQLQEDVYRSILMEVKQEILTAVSNLGLDKSQITVLSALTKLRQVCDHPSLALPEINAAADSGKMDALMELINEAGDGGHKIVVFSQFVKMLKLMAAKLRENKIRYEYLDGATTDRMARINCFNNTPEIPVFLISLKAGGVGINLTAADIVIHADPWWNPMVEKQATDRVHRLGQQKPVMVYKLITRGTVEEKLLRLQERKKALFETIFPDNGDPVNSLTWEEIKELFEIAE